MPTKKSRKSKTPTRKKPAKARVRGEPKALAGKSMKAEEFNPSEPALDAMAATLREVKEPRPYLSRYPIPDEEFRRLKERANKIKLPSGAATLAKDSGTKREVSAVAVVPVEKAPAQTAPAPNPATNVTGLPAPRLVPAGA